MHRVLLAALLTLAACHKDSPVGTYDLAAPSAPPDLAMPPTPTPLVTLDGKKADLSTYRKRVTLIAMWATYCDPCMKEMPMLEALHEKTKDDTDLAIIGVSEDPVASDGDRAHVATVAAGLKVTFPMLIDRDRVLAARFQQKDGDAAKEVPDGGEAAMALPTMITLLANGHYARHSGFNETLGADTFVSDGMANIARAETGDLPKDDYDDSPPPSMNTPGAVFKMMIPSIPKSDFATKWPIVQKDLKDKMHLDGKAIADAEAQLKAGGPAYVEIKMPKK